MLSCWQGMGTEDSLRVAVRDLVAAAIKREHKAANLARLIEDQVGHRYSESTISSWGRGRIEPPASAFLAVAKVSGLSVDETLNAPSLTAKVATLEDQVSNLYEEQIHLRETLSSFMRALRENMEIDLSSIPNPSTDKG